MFKILFFLTGVFYYYNSISSLALRSNTEGTPLTPQAIDVYGMHSYNFIQNEPDESIGEIEDDSDEE